MKRKLSPKQKAVLERNAFKRGESGCPGGVSPARSLTHELRVLLAQAVPGERRTWAALLANILVDLAAKGDVRAFEVILSRTEGSVRQQLSVDGLHTQPYGKVLTLDSFRGMTDEELDQHYNECCEVLARSKKEVQ